MVMSSRSTIVGVFRDQTMAEQALNALTTAGFTPEQIRYSGTNGSSGSFFGELKSIFTGEGAANGSFTQDIAAMGLSDEEARYYENEFRSGNRVLAVKAPGREQEAMSILHQYGAYNHTMHSANTNAARNPNYTQPVAVNASQVARQQDTHYGQPPTNQAHVDAERTARREQVAQEETVKENRDNLQPRTQSPQMPQTAQAQAASSGITQANQVSTTAANSDPQLQAMQAQLQSLQQQIRDTHTQLETTKQREAQLQAVRMRDTRMQELQKQLQEAQAQLQSAQQELQSSQARVDQLGR